MCDIKNMTVEQVVATYVKIRDAKRKLEQEQAEALAPYDEALEKLGAQAVAMMAEQGVESFRTPSGTIYKRHVVSITSADKEAFLNYVIGSGHYELLDARPAKTAIEEFAAETGELPPGLNRVEVIKAGVRRGE
jgi:hypothetical protein